MLVTKTLEWVWATDSGKDRSKIRPAVPTPTPHPDGCRLWWDVCSHS